MFFIWSINIENCNLKKIVKKPLYGPITNSHLKEKINYDYNDYVKILLKKWPIAFGNKNASISIAIFVYKLKWCIKLRYLHYSTTWLCTWVRVYIDCASYTFQLSIKKCLIFDLQMTGTIYIPLRHYLPSLQSFLEFHLNPENFKQFKTN